MRVVSWPPPDERTPALVIGPGYDQTANTAEIRWFEDGSPLLSDVNFDVLETLTLPELELPRGFAPVLTGIDGRVHVAIRNDPPAAYIPGLPVNTDTAPGRFSTTVFYNAVRHLLRERPLPPLYTLTSPAHPSPQGNRLALHPDEGDTAIPPVSSGRLFPIRPGLKATGKKLLWPLLVMVSVFIFSLERVLACYGGNRWR